MSLIPPPFSDQNQEKSLFDPSDKEFKTKVSAGVFITAVAQLNKLIIQIASVVVLSRLLTPDAFGLIAMTVPVLSFIAIIQDLGLSQATIQKPKLTQRQASLMFWTNFATGCGGALILVLLAPLVGRFYKEDDVTLLLLASAPLAIWTSLGAQHRALLNRQMRFFTLALIDVGGAWASFIVALICAWYWGNYWALYSASVAAALVSVVGSVITTRWIPSRPTSDPELGNMIRFGTAITGFATTNFISRNMDNVLIGQVWGSYALGLYDRAYKFLLFPLQQINSPISQVMIPTLSRLVIEPNRYRSTYCRILRFMMLVTLPGVLFLVTTADWIIPLTLGQSWAGVTPLYRLLGAAGLVQAFINPIGWLFITQGRAGQFARWGAASAVVSTCAFVIGLPWGPTGVALAYAVSEVFLRTPAYCWYAGREGPVSTTDLLKLAGPYAFASAVTGSTVFFGRLIWFPQPVAGLLVIAPLCHVIFYGVICIFPSGRKCFSEAITFTTNLLHHFYRRSNLAS